MKYQSLESEIFSGFQVTLFVLNKTNNFDKHCKFPDFRAWNVKVKKLTSDSNGNWKLCQFLEIWADLDPLFGHGLVFLCFS